MPNVARRTLLAGMAMLASMKALRTAAASEQPAMRQSFDYAMRVAGLEIAEILMVFETNESSIDVALRMRNKGLAAWIAGKTKTVMQSKIHLAENGIAQPSSFQATYRKPDRTREIDLAYDDVGELADISIQSSGRARESDVPKELQSGTVDPLTAFVRLKAWLQSRPEPGDELTIAVFEGRKRADLQARYEGFQGAHLIKVCLIGLVGFDDSDRLVSLPGQEKVWMDVKVSGDDDPVLVSVDSTVAAVTTKIELAR